MTSRNRVRSCSNPNSYPSSAAAVIAAHFDAARTSKQASESDSHRARVSENEGMSTRVSGQIETVQATHVPHWQRELANSRVGRQSRASSIISTRTRLTHQSDDATSIEFEAGGQSFRISRDGSRVTNMTAPPPYPGPPLEGVVEESDEEDHSGSTRHSSDTTRHESSIAEIEAEDQLVHQGLPVRTHWPPGALPSDESPDTNRRPGVLELPQRLKSVLGLRWYGSTSAVPHVDQSAVGRTTGALRRTQSESSSLRSFKPALAGPADDQEESSDVPVLNAERQMQGLRRAEAFSTIGWSESDEQAAEISHNYTRMMRDIDHQHRKRLHERDNELARMRELLDEKDKVYRQQLKERDYAIESLHEHIRFKNDTINRLKTCNYEMEEDMQRRLDWARNEVEDIWEKRWKDHETLLMDRLGSDRRRMPEQQRRDTADPEGGGQTLDVCE